MSRTLSAPISVQRWQLLALGPVVAAAAVLVLVASAPAGERLDLGLAATVAAAAGLSATSIGVFGGVLVPGLLLLGVPPTVTAPLSLLLQIVVIPLGATSHAVVGHVKRAITVPLIVGGVAGSIGGATLASSVPAAVVARIVSLVIVAVGLIVLANIRNGYGAGAAGHEDVHTRRIGAIGGVAGFASGISGAGWGPIGVKLLILSGLEPRHAIGSSLVGRITMATAAVVTYVFVAFQRGTPPTIEPRLFAVLLCASAAAMIPGTMVIARIGRRPAAAGVAILSIALALPTLLGGA